MRADLAERFKAYLHSQHKGGVSPEATALLLDVYDVLVDIRKNSLDEEPPKHFRSGRGRRPGRPSPRPAAFGSALFKVLVICQDRPLRIPQIIQRHALRWSIRLSDTQATSALYRLVKLGFLARPHLGHYVLTDLGRQHLAAIEEPE